ncbi:MAG: hypothetical protein ACKVHL_01070, partial [Rhodospirillales bacterium]
LRRAALYPAELRVLGDPPDGFERPGEIGRTLPGVAGGRKRTVNGVAVSGRFCVCFQRMLGTQTAASI